MKITEEQAREMIYAVFPVEYFKSKPWYIEEESRIINSWKMYDWIEQSREEEIRKDLNYIENEKSKKNKTQLKYIIILQKELIEILDKKIKENKDV